MGGGITRYEFLESDRTSDDAKYIVHNCCTPNWYNAGFAHVTPFSHAKAHGFKRFWNIDGDDTMLCLFSERAAEMLKTIEKYADSHNIDIF